MTATVLCLFYLVNVFFWAVLAGASTSDYLSTCVIDECPACNGKNAQWVEV